MALRMPQPQQAGEHQSNSSAAAAASEGGRPEDEGGRGGHLEVQGAPRAKAASDARQGLEDFARAEAESRQETAEDFAQQRCSNLI